MKTCLAAAASILALTVTACGGGGGAAPPMIAGLDGTWRGALTLAQDQCLINTNPLHAVHQVTISGQSVSVVPNDGRRYDGTADSASGFMVEMVDTQSFPIIDRITYADIADGRAQVTVTHIWSRPGGCVTAWKGQMTRD